jgi:hypothetical protein
MDGAIALHPGAEMNIQICLSLTVQYRHSLSKVSIASSRLRGQYHGSLTRCEYHSGYRPIDVPPNLLQVARVGVPP